MRRGPGREGNEREGRAGQPVESIASLLQRLVVRLGLAGLIAAGLFVAALDERTAPEVALSLANMAVVAVVSWRARGPARWGTVLLAALGWTAARLDLGAGWPPAIPWRAGALRLGVLVSVAGSVSAFRDALDRLVQTEDALAAALVRERDSARRDRLTRLWNARFFHEALEAEIARCRRYGRPFGLLLLDLDEFKAVNDRAGHLAGDQVLQAVGRVLARHCRATDIPARLHGDEFAVLLPEATVEMVERYAAKLAGLVREAVALPGLPRVSASIGGVAFERAPVSARAAVAAADAAMYAAKRAGKDRARVAAVREPVT